MKRPTILPVSDPVNREFAAAEENSIEETLVSKVKIRPAENLHRDRY
jgi:hypothetical protein